MPAKKYLKIDAATGAPTEEAGQVVSAGAADDGKLVALDATGKIDVTVLPTGLGPDTITVTTSEALAAGDMVNLHDSAGIKARKANASAIGTMCHGYVAAAFGSGATATVYKDGTLTGLSGLTVGATYFLSESTSGTIELFSTLAATAGHIVQRIGVAKSATELVVDINETPMVRA